MAPRPALALLLRLWPPPGLRLTVPVLGLTQTISWGTTFYAPAVLAPAVIAETGWSRTEVFGAFSASLVLGALLAKPAGRLIDRRGGRRAMLAGSLLAAAGLLVAAVAPSFAIYAAAWLVLGVAMRLALYEAAFATLTAAAGGEARRAISVLTLYGGFASSIFWPIGYALVEAAGWRATFLAFAAMNLAICAPLHGFALPRPASATPAGEAPATVAEGSLAPGERRLAFWLLTAALALFTYVNSALSAHLIDTLVAFDLPRAEAVGIASLRGVGQVVGRIWEMLFAAGLPPLALCLIAIGLTPLAIATLLLGGGVLAAAFALLQGGSNGLVTIVRGVAPLLLFGARDYGALIGAMTGPGLFVSALAPACHAAIIDLAGQGAALAVATGAVALAFLLVLILALGLRKS